MKNIIRSLLTELIKEDPDQELMQLLSEKLISDNNTLIFDDIKFFINCGFEVQAIPVNGYEEEPCTICFSDIEFYIGYFNLFLFHRKTRRFIYVEVDKNTVEQYQKRNDQLTDFKKIESTFELEFNEEIYF